MLQTDSYLYRGYRLNGVPGVLVQIETILGELIDELASGDFDEARALVDSWLEAK